MRILVVDDEKIKRVTLTDDLAAQGHEAVKLGALDFLTKPLPRQAGQTPTPVESVDCLSEKFVVIDIAGG